MQCNILYDSSKIGKLRIAVSAYLKSENFDRFKSFFLAGKLPQEVRVSLKSSDSVNEL